MTGYVCPLSANRLAPERAQDGSDSAGVIA